MLEPYLFQAEAVGDTIEAADAGINPVIASPVGSGKSLMAALLARHFIGRGLSVIIMAHRRELIAQNAAEAERVGVSCRIISAALKPVRSVAACTVGSVQTLANRKTPPADIVIIDECHRMPWRNKTESNYSRALARHPAARLIGLSGTPFRSTGGPVCGPQHWKWFRRVSASINMLDLIRDGHLARPTSIVGEDIIDEAELRHSRATGDFATDSIIVRDGGLEYVVDDSIRKLEGRRSIIVFAASIAQCDALHSLLAARGESVATVHSRMEGGRDAAVSAYKSGDARWLITRDIALEGFNHPPTDGLVWARPTESKIVWIQGCGRGLRLSPGKDNVLVLDYCGNIGRNGAIDDADAQYSPNLCEQCGEENPPLVRNCENCGHTMITQSDSAIAPEPELESPDAYALDAKGGILSDEVRAGTGWETVEIESMLLRPSKLGTSIVANYKLSGRQPIQIYYPVVSSHQWLVRRSLDWFLRAFPGRRMAGAGAREMLQVAARDAPRVPRRAKFRRNKRGFWEITDEEYA